MEPVFTPLDNNFRRLRFSRSDVKVISGSLDFRGIGKKAVVEIDGKRYNVYGRACGAPHCQCDAQIKEAVQAIK